MPFHTDPHFALSNVSQFSRFLKRFGIDPHHDHGTLLLKKLCVAFSQIPYENLTKIIKSDTGISTGAVKRLPDEVIRDYLHYGTGGTCFSLTAAFIAILNALDIEAHPILADRHYGSDTHCALVFSQEAGLLLLDPGYLINTPTPLPTINPTRFPTTMNTIELCPLEAGRKVELFTIVNNDRRSRLTYKITPVDGPSFGRAWERSFAWEMMTYPVLTRCTEGVHYYLQGTMLRIRDGQQSVKHTLSPDEQYDFASKTLGIHKNIITKAFSVV